MKKQTGKSKTTSIKPPDYYIETSIPIKLLFGHTKVKSKLREILAGRRLSSSFYVLMEYKRTIVKTLIEFFYIAKEEDTPADALRYYTETFSTRGPKIILNALAKLVGESDLANDKEKFLIKLEMLIESALRHFDNIVWNYVPNRTNCPLAKASTGQGFDVFLREIECLTDCSVEKLWHQNRSRLKQLTAKATDEPHKSNKGFQKPLSVVSSAITDPSIPKSKTNCKKAGDFIIALEMPDNMTLVTFDKAFESICTILGRQYYLLPSPMSIQST